MNFTNTTAIVLGGMGDIGKEICLQLIRRGVKVKLIDFALNNLK